MHTRNVLLLIADDWSPIARCYGNPVIQTPNIDALAERATVFDRAFCTTPSCGASRANLLTGVYAHQNGQYGHCHSHHGFRTHEHFATRTLPAVLRQAGVFTGLVGKLHVAPESVYPFDLLDQSSPASVEAMTTSARQFYETAGDRPFYLQAASTYPHRAGANSGFPRSLHGDEMQADDVLYAPDDLIVPDWLPDLPEVREDLSAYYTFVSRFDRFVGAMLDELERAGRADDTTVILMSDHGMPFPGAKASPYESGHHCPLLIARPGSKGLHNNALVNWCDIYPTVCECLGVSEQQMPDDLPGRSLLPILEQAEPKGWDQTFYAHNFHEIANYYPYRVLRESRYKFVHHLAYELTMPLAGDLFNSATWQALRRAGQTHMGKRALADVMHHTREALYDLDNDPAEAINLIDHADYQDVAERMRQTLMAFREQTNDPWLSQDRQRQQDPAMQQAMHN